MRLLSALREEVTSAWQGVINNPTWQDAFAWVLGGGLGYAMSKALWG